MLSNNFHTMHTENNYRIPHKHRHTNGHVCVQFIFPGNMMRKQIIYSYYNVHTALSPCPLHVFTLYWSTGITLFTPRFGNSHSLVSEYCWNLKCLASDTVHGTCHRDSYFSDHQTSPSLHHFLPHCSIRLTARDSRAAHWVLQTNVAVICWMEAVQFRPVSQQRSSCLSVRQPSFPMSANHMLRARHQLLPLGFEVLKTECLVSSNMQHPAVGQNSNVSEQRIVSSFMAKE
jgi:hypothetical protein